MRIFGMPGSRRPAGMLTVLCGAVMTLSLATPASAGSPSPAGHLVKQTHKVTVSTADVQRTAAAATVRRTDGKVVPMSAQATPNCLAGSSDGTTYYPGSPPVWEYVYEWYWDSATHLTESADVTWKAELQCNNMNFISISSNLYFRNNQVSAGYYESCGTTSNTRDNGCGFRQTAGEWVCAGIGNCGGSYWASFGWTWILPAGWAWATLPGDCSKLSAREALCLWTTPSWTIPTVN